MSFGGFAGFGGRRVTLRLDGEGSRPRYDEYLLPSLFSSSRTHPLPNGGVGLP